MCHKRNSVERKINGIIKRLDSCIADLIVDMNNEGVKTIASCCGHGIYPITIVYRALGEVREFRSGVIFPKNRKYFYKMDSKGFYFLR